MIPSVTNSVVAKEAFCRDQIDGTTSIFGQSTPKAWTSINLFFDIPSPHFLSIEIKIDSTLSALISETIEHSDVLIVRK